MLERLWILDPVPGWKPTRNQLSRLVAAPQHHLVDPALTVSLLGMDADALLSGEADPTIRDGPALGHLFESLIALCLRVYAQHSESRVGHLRTRAGKHEIDFIVERRDQRIVAVEVKLARSVRDHDVRHLMWLHEELGADLLDAVVITTGSEAYRRQDGIGVVPAALLGP